GYTKVRERVDDEVEMRFEYLGGEDMAIRLGPGAIPSFDVIDPAGDDGWLRNAGYGLDRLVVAPKQVDDEALSAKFDFTWTGEAATWKAGLLGRWRDRDVNVDEAEFRRGPEIDPSDWTAAAPSLRHGLFGEGLSSSAMRDWLRGNRDALSAPPGRGRKHHDLPGRGLHRGRGRARRLPDGNGGRGPAARDRRRAGGADAVRGQRLARGPGRGRRARHDPGVGLEFLHQRAAGPAPALRHRWRLGAARRGHQDHRAPRLRRHLAARQHQPRRRGGQPGQPAARPLRVDQHRPVAGALHRRVGP